MVALFSSTAAVTSNATESSTASATKVPPGTVHIYPFGTDIASLKQRGYRQVKTVYYIRHAEGTHNVKKQYQDMIHLDARLTQLGESQCRELAERIRAGQDEVARQLSQNVELVISSPLTRCMQTALLSLEPVLQLKTDVRVVAHDGIRETVNFNCDRKRHLSELQKEFGHIVDFQHVAHPHDHIWDQYEALLGDHEAYPGHRESAQVYQVAERARQFLVDFLSQQPESHICLCSHRAFSRALWNFGIGEATLVSQSLDDRENPMNVPVVQYMGDDAFAASLQADYDNCELRSMIVAFR